MAGFDIVIVGDKRVAAKLSNFDEKLHRSLLVADHEAARILEVGARGAAPEPKSASEVQGHGIFSEVKSLFRLAGRAPGGKGFISRETHFVELGIRDGTVAAYVEGGTGIYARPERGGPFTPWTETIKPVGGKALAFPGRAQDKPNAEGMIFRKSANVHILGAHAHPFLAASAEAARPEIDALYDHTVAEAAREAN